MPAQEIGKQSARTNCLHAGRMEVPDVRYRPNWSKLHNKRRLVLKSDKNNLPQYTSLLIEHILCPGNKSQITNNCKIFLGNITEHENSSANKYENASYYLHFHIY